MIVELYHSGQSVRSLSSEYGVSEVTIYAWIKKFNPIELEDGSSSVTPNDYSKLQKQLLKLQEHWLKYSISAFFNTILFFGLHTFGLMYLPSGFFSVLVYLQPLLLSVFAALILDEYFSWVRILGLVLGSNGIFIATIDGFTTYVSIFGVIIALLTGVSWSFGVIYIKRCCSVIRSRNSFRKLAGHCLECFLLG